MSPSSPSTGRAGASLSGRRRSGHWPSWLMATPLLIALIVPLLALFAASSSAELLAALRHPRLLEAVSLSLRTSLISLLLMIVCGTPLAWRIARGRGRRYALLEALVAVPVVLPPAVVGIALLHAFGRRGWLGGIADGALGDALAFSAGAVVLAQVVVASPFYLQAAITAFRAIDEDQLLVARSLGATARGALWKIALPAALPGLLSGAMLAWARAIGEFGATLLFAGNLPGRTQTLPLAIYAALEDDVGLARALALLLGGFAFSAVFLVYSLPHLLDLKRRFTRSVGLHE